MNETTEKQFTLGEFLILVKSWTRYIVSKWLWLVLTGIIFGLLGILYAWKQKPVYTAELTFAADNDNASKLGSYAGLASQFGLDLGGGSGSVFEGDNLMLLLSSRLLVEKTMLTPVVIDGRQQLLINYYIKANDLDKNWKKDTALSKVTFTADQHYGQRARDSVMKAVCKNIINHALLIDKVDKRMNIVSVQMRANDELFAKNFVEQLANNAIQFYIDYKIKKTRQNVQILQKQTDSVRNMLSGNIVAVAVSNDLNVNPIRQLMQANVQRKQVDVQVNGQVYGELLKQLEFAKISLRKETPLIQVIDTPQLPLEKKKLGRALAGIGFGLLGVFIAFIFFVSKRIFKNALNHNSGEKPDIVML